MNYHSHCNVHYNTNEIQSKLYDDIVVQAIKPNSLKRPEWLGTDMTRLLLTLAKMDDCFPTFLTGMYIAI